MGRAAQASQQRPAADVPIAVETDLGVINAASGSPSTARLASNHPAVMWALERHRRSWRTDAWTLTDPQESCLYLGS